MNVQRSRCTGGLQININDSTPTLNVYLSDGSTWNKQPIQNGCFGLVPDLKTHTEMAIIFPLSRIPWLKQVS